MSEFKLLAGRHIVAQSKMRYWCVQCAQDKH